MDLFIKTQFWLGVVAVIANMLVLALGAKPTPVGPGSRVINLAMHAGMSIWAAYLLWVVSQ